MFFYFLVVKEERVENYFFSLFFYIMDPNNMFENC